MAWLVDHSGTVYLLLGLTTLILAGLFKVTGQVRYLGYLGLVLGALGLVWLLGMFVVTDRRQVELNLKAMALAIVERKPEVLEGLISDHFEYGPYKKKDLSQRIRPTAEGYRIRDIHLSQFEIKDMTSLRATVEFAYNVHFDTDAMFPGYCVAVMVKEENIWKLQGLTVYRGIAGQKQIFQVPLR